ncbi:hypothetical protein HKD37_11G031494 [Glycine soja]
MKAMATPPPSPPQSENPPEVTSKRTRQSTRLRSLMSRCLDGPRPVVNVNPATGRGSGPHKEKFYSYLGVVAREKVPIVHANWNVVPDDLKSLIWKDILRKFDIPEARWRQFKSSLTSKFVFVDNEGLDPETWAEFAKSRKTPNWQEIQKFNDCPHVLSCGGYELLDKKLMEEKSKRGHKEHSCTESPTLNVDSPSPVARHLKWKIARTKRHGQMTSEVAQEIADKIDSLQEQATQGSFVPHGRQDILNTALGRPEHPGRARVAETGVTISQYFGQASRASSTSSPSINQQQLADIIGGIKDDIRKQLQDEMRKEVQDEIRKEVQQEHKQQQEAWMRAVEEKQWQNLEMMKQELKKSLKVELSHIASHQSTLIEAPEIQALLVRVSTKGSCTGPEGSGLLKELLNGDDDLMGLFVVVGENTVLAGLGKVFENSSTIHNVRYENDVVKVQVVRTYMPHAEVPIPTSEVHYLEQAVGTFVAWLTHLVREVTNEVVVGPDKFPSKSVGELNRLTSVATDDPLGELVKKSYVVYTKPMELAWDGAKFGLPNASNGFFITHADVTEIILGDKCLNIFVLQLWMMFMNDWSTSIGFSPVYGFLEPQSIRCTKDTREECQKYIETWVKESHREIYLGPYFNQAHWKLLVLCPRENIKYGSILYEESLMFTLVYYSKHYMLTSAFVIVKFSAMKKICSNLQGKDNAPPPPPQWIKAKSHVQQGAYECGYYVMHWMWCIVSAGLKNELHNYFLDGTTLDTNTMTTIHKKWAAYFLEVGKWMSAFDMFLLGSFSPPQPSHTLVQEIIEKAPQMLVNDLMCKVLPIALKKRNDCEELAITTVVSGNLEELNAHETVSEERVSKILDVHVHVETYVPPTFGIWGNGVHLAVVGYGRNVAAAKYSDWVSWKFCLQWRIRKPLEKLRPPSILEGCVANVFVICCKERNSNDEKALCDYGKKYSFQVQTAPISDGVLPGTIRQLVLQYDLIINYRIRVLSRTGYEGVKEFHFEKLLHHGQNVKSGRRHSSQGGPGMITTVIQI